MPRKRHIDNPSPPPVAPGPANAEQKDAVYTIPELAARWRVSRHTITAAITAGRLQAFKVGERVYRIRDAALAICCCSYRSTSASMPSSADKLRELLATRPAMPNTEELVRWWRASAELLPGVLDQPKPEVLTTGRLDGLVISPIRDGGEIRFLDFTVNTLPGLRLVLEADAARELRDALGMILGAAGATHGAEAEELRRGIERILATGRTDTLFADLRRLLDSTDAREWTSLKAIVDALAAADKRHAEDRAQNDVLKQEVRELEQQRDALRAEAAAREDWACG